ncbi:hypothetical protein BAUCODRAFT_401463 [Baudoinia panamericana UAMH 10762]|uniref:Alpha/beta hydrolase fold-3 domain-containing protein n=1 Tax=Baudoinia panamericana (strain UAMH 10762) TaxID=717646 RepID=M2NJ09_BAUPA|nr:uncharacterized protein BAUCODRAFT_401463 [Baudoinia panamericana UAMH 10762]EMC99379.1 hypothetical protein BAUCODRAFT_401463 [Baudoinia panamericana UAMH 10762]
MTTRLPSPEELDKLSNIDQEIAEKLQFIPQLWQPSADQDPAEVIRSIRAQREALPHVPAPKGVLETQATYKARDGTTLRMCVYSPASSVNKPRPLFVWYFGGGGCIGVPEHQIICRNAVLDHGCIAVAPQYRLAPEYKYPYQVNDSWDALKHITAHAGDFSADPSAGFVLGGESAGAVIAAPLALKARDEALQPPLTGIFLTVGSYFDPNSVPDQYKSTYRSRYDEACLNAPLLSKTMKAIFDTCLQGDFSSPMFKAALWPSGHARLPKTYLQSCGMDINRDEGICYNDVLSKAGVETKLDVYPGCPHCFWYLFPNITQGVKWKEDTRKGLGWLFERQM